MIEAACEGLIYISETDAPVQPFAGVVVEQLGAHTKDAPLSLRLLPADQVPVLFVIGPEDAQGALRQRLRNLDAIND